jgi:uncharacterized sulfatase
MMVSHFYVHTPVETSCEWLLEKYAAKIPADSPNRERRIKYAAFVESLDHYAGQLLAALDDSGHADKTLVVFTSDNGGHPEYTANEPLRGSKWNLYEGGIRVPFIARWPGQIVAPGTCSTPVIGYDLLPTFVEVAGGAPGKDDPPIDGESIVRLFRTPSDSIGRTLYWHFPYYHPEKGYSKSRDQIGMSDFAVSQTRPQSAVRKGSHKLIYFHEDERTELFDLAASVSEQNDLRSANPGLTAELKRELEAYFNRVNARLPTRSALAPN